MDKLLERWEAEEEAKKQALLDEIKQAQDRIAAKDKVIEELQFERKLIFDNFLSIINEKLRLSSFNLFCGFNKDMFYKAWKWSNRKDEELTEDERKCFTLIVDSVKKYFFGDLKEQVKFKEMFMNWTTGYDYTYIYKDQEITIFVPLFLVDEKTWQDALGGYRVIYQESKYCSSLVCSGLDYKKVAKELQDWMLTEGWKK